MDGFYCCLGVVIGVEFVEDILYMGFNCVYGDIEFFCNVGIIIIVYN